MSVLGARTGSNERLQMKLRKTGFQRRAEQNGSQKLEPVRATAQQPRGVYGNRVVMGERNLNFYARVEIFPFLKQG